MTTFLGRLRTPQLSAAPATPAQGEMYFDTSTNLLYFWDGTRWVPVRDNSTTPVVYDTDQIGTVKSWTGKTIPTGWLLAAGQTLNESAGYVDLANFAAAEVAAGNPLWGISGTAPNRVITLPNLTRKMIYGSTSPSSDLGTSYQGGGTETITPSIANLPVHDHSLQNHTHPIVHDHALQVRTDGSSGNGVPLASGGPASVDQGGGGAGTPVKMYNGSSSGPSTNLTGSSGSGTPINTLPPHILLAFIIKVKGVLIDSGGALVGPTGPKGDPGPWRGAWAAATAYAVGDSVSYASGGTTASYRRKVAGTTPGTPLADTTNWELIASGGSIGADGAIAVYEQPSMPATTQVGAIWIDTDEVPPLFGPTIPVVTSLPGSPYDGQEVYFLASDTLGIMWRLRYRAGSASAYKWEYIGGPPLTPPQTASLNPSTSYATIAGLTVTLPRSGDYLVSFGAACYLSNANQTLNVAVKRGAAATSDGDGFRLQVPSANLVTSGHAWSKVFAGCVAADVYAIQAKASLAGGSVESAWMSILPVRLS